MKLKEILIACCKLLDVDLDDLQGDSKGLTKSAKKSAIMWYLFKDVPRVTATHIQHAFSFISEPYTITVLTRIQSSIKEQKPGGVEAHNYYFMLKRKGIGLK